jgi:hypothetical protein
MKEQFPVPSQQGTYKQCQPAAPSATGAHDGNTDESCDGLMPTSLASRGISK